MSSTTLDTPEIACFPIVEQGPGAHFERLEGARSLVTDCLIAKFDAAYDGDIGVETIIPSSNEYGFVVRAYAKHFSNNVYPSIDALQDTFKIESEARRSVLKNGLQVIPDTLWDEASSSKLSDQKVEFITQSIANGNFSDVRSAIGCFAYQEILAAIRRENEFLANTANYMNQIDSEPIPTQEVESWRRRPGPFHAARLAIYRYLAA